MLLQEDVGVTELRIPLPPVWDRLSSSAPKDVSVTELRPPLSSLACEGLCDRSVLPQHDTARPGCRGSVCLDPAWEGLSVRMSSVFLYLYLLDPLCCPNKTPHD